MIRAQLELEPNKQTGGSPALTASRQAALGAAVEGTPRSVGIAIANWNWKAERTYPAEQFDVHLGKRSCLRYVHWLGFAHKRPKKQLARTDAEKRATFVQEYRTLVAEARQTGATIFFVDEAHFRADGDLRTVGAPRHARAGRLDQSAPG